MSLSGDCNPCNTLWGAYKIASSMLLSMNGTQFLCMQMCLLAFLSSHAEVSGEKLHKVHVLLVQEHGMLQQHVCHKCGYSTKQIGHYNRHVPKPGTCKRKDLEHCRHRQKSFAKGGSGLRKHPCRANGLLLPFNMDCPADRTSSVRFAMQELQKLSKYQTEQLGLADLTPVDVAVAAIRYLHFTPLLAQSHNITLCQHHIAKFDIVQQGSGSLVWVPHLKDDAPSVLLDEAADMMQCLAQAKLPKRQMEHSHFLVRQGLASILEELSFRVLGPLQKAATTTAWAKGSCMCCYTAWDEVMHKVGQRANTRMKYEYMVVDACSNCTVTSFVLQPIPNPHLLCPLWEAYHHQSVSMKAKNTHIRNFTFIVLYNIFLCMTETQANFQFLFWAFSGYEKYWKINVCTWLFTPVQTVL